MLSLSLGVTAANAAICYVDTKDEIMSTASWTIRAIGLRYHMYYSGYYLRNEWATVDRWLVEQHVTPDTPEAVRLVAALRSAAIEMPMLNSHLLPRWAERWFA